MALTSGQEEEYLARAAEARAALEADGLHCWLFRNREDPRQLFEFVEGPEGPGGGLPCGPAALDALRRLEGIGTRAPDAGDLWDEVPFPRSS